MSSTEIEAADGKKNYIATPARSALYHALTIIYDLIALEREKKTY
jgi:hypothetical protein